MNGSETSHNSKRRRGISLVPVLLVLMFLFSLTSRAESFSSAVSDSSGTVNEKTITPDTNTVKYDVNDPRNPDCPCHAAQKLADEEYRRSHEQNNPNLVDQNPNPDVIVQTNTINNTNVNTNAAPVTTNSAGSQKHYSKYYKFQKKVGRWNKKMKRRLGKKHNGTKKGKRRLADCFHWD
jgi:hypothetical protein